MEMLLAMEKTLLQLGGKINYKSGVKRYWWK
jgi:hypothetical protein